MSSVGELLSKLNEVSLSSDAATEDEVSLLRDREDSPVIAESTALEAKLATADLEDAHQSEGGHRVAVDEGDQQLSLEQLDAPIGATEVQQIHEQQVAATHHSGGPVHHHPAAVSAVIAISLLVSVLLSLILIFHS